MWPDPLFTELYCFIQGVQQNMTIARWLESRLWFWNLFVAFSHKNTLTSMNNTDRTLDVVFFSRFRGRSSKELQAWCAEWKDREKRARNSFGLLPQGYYERKPLNHKKTTSSVLLLLIYAYRKLFFQLRLHELLQTVYSPKHLLFNRFSNEPVVSHE